MNETDNEGDDVLLASLSAITEERDQALTLLARTSASLFRLLGPAENSTKMLSTLRMLVELLGAGGGSRSGAEKAGDGDTCRGWCVMLEHIEAALAGVVKVQANFQECDGLFVHASAKVDTREDAKGTGSFAACPDPPGPTERSLPSSPPGQPVDDGTILGGVASTGKFQHLRTTGNCKNDGDGGSAYTGGRSSAGGDASIDELAAAKRTIVNLREELADARMGLRTLRSRQFFPDTDDDNEADLREAAGCTEGKRGARTGAVRGGNVTSDQSRVGGDDVELFKGTATEGGVSVSAISRRELLALLEQERRNSFSAQGVAAAAEAQKVALETQVDDLLQLAAVAGAEAERGRLLTVASSSVGSLSTLAHLRHVVGLLCRRVKAQAAVQATMRSSIENLARKVQHMDDVRTIEMERLHVAGGRLRKQLEAAFSTLHDAEDYVADLEMELVLHGLGMVGSSTGFVGKHAVDLSKKVPIFAPSAAVDSEEWTATSHRQHQQTRAHSLSRGGRIIFGHHEVLSADDSEIGEELVQQLAQRRRRLLARVNPLASPENAQALHVHHLRMELRQDEAFKRQEMAKTEFLCETQDGGSKSEDIIDATNRGYRLATSAVTTATTSSDSPSKKPDGIQGEAVVWEDAILRDELVNQAYEWEEKSGDLVGSWVDVIEMESPPAHSLFSPVVNELLCQWTGDGAKKQALIEWMTRVLSGDVQEFINDQSFASPPPIAASSIKAPSFAKQDSIGDNGGLIPTALGPSVEALPPVSPSPSLKGGFVPCLQLMKLRRETLDGFMAIVFPLLLRRRDIAVDVSTRERRTTVYDVRVQVQSATAAAARAKAEAFKHADNDANQPTTSMLLSKSHSASKADSKASTLTVMESTNPRQSTASLHGFQSHSTKSLQNGTLTASEIAHNSESAWRARHRMALRAALKGYVDEDDAGNGHPESVDIGDIDGLGPKLRP